MIDRFQAGTTNALVCVVGAGSLGITLTAAQTVILVERPWTPGGVVQCEDRLHRIGQVGSVTSIWLQFGEMDDRVDRLLEQKQRVIDHVLTGLADVEPSGMNRSVLSSAREILTSIRSGIPLEQLLSQREKELFAQAQAAAAAKAAKQSETPTAVLPAVTQQRPTHKRARAGRPRKGGDDALLRQGFEITLDVETLTRLTAQTKNRSAYIEQLILDAFGDDTPEQLEQIQAKLKERCQHLPPAVARVIQQICETRGARVALEASEAVALLVDPGRTRLP
jgi:hypothetical protein